jgi:hypothetical protein
MNFFIGFSYIKTNLESFCLQYFILFFVFLTVLQQLIIKTTDFEFRLQFDLREVKVKIKIYLYFERIEWHLKFKILCFGDPLLRELSKTPQYSRI